MSFGWGAGDIRALIQDLWTIIDAIRNGPEKYRRLCDAADDLYRTLEELKNNVLESDDSWSAKVQPRLQNLQSIVENCSASLREVREFLAKNHLLKLSKVPLSQKFRSMVSRYKVGVKDESEIRLRFISHQQSISTFLQSLSYGTLNQVNQRLTRMESNSMISNSRSPPSIQSHFHFHQPQLNYQPSFSSAPKIEEPVHNAICDGCNYTIRGLRYQCNVCDDFDFCQNCIKNARRNHNPRHNFTLLHGPDELGKNYPQSRVIDMEDDYGFRGRYQPSQQWSPWN